MLLGDKKHIPAGYLALIQKLDLKVLPHFRVSYVTLTGVREVIFRDPQEIHTYSKKYLPKNPEDVFEQLEFAVTYDGINLEILKAVFLTISKENMASYVQQHPTGKMARRLWYLYEFLTKIQLDIPNAKGGSYTKLLDEKEYYTGISIRSVRHYIDDNLLGNAMFCPVVRRTEELAAFEKSDLKKQASEIIRIYDPQVVARATDYLYFKETKSSYEIEKERPDQQRLTRFSTLLEKSGEIDYLSKEKLIELQNLIVDKRFSDPDFRGVQNYIGTTLSLGREKIHYISPKPENVSDLMNGLLACYERMRDTNINPVIVASVISFGFVFIHPFNDGNGRIHRFLIHNILSKLGFTPDNMIFPVSAVILKDLQSYDQCLERFSKLIMEAIENYQIDTNGELKVNEETLQYYQYIDFTRFAEYLFSCIKSTIQKDFPEQLDYLVAYDKTKKSIQNIVDMPDRLINLIINFILQNNGKLSSQKRDKYFFELSEEELQSIENVVQENMSTIFNKIKD
ncbi:MAG: Fic family protein [Proteobacteria bacterium]|nr:Fic family protein [Pseudomonadota bacterium]